MKVDEQIGGVSSNTFLHTKDQILQAMKENERDCLQRKEMCSMELQLPDFTKSINLDHSYALVDKNHRYEYIVHCCTVYFPSQK
jgi:hypothetical protein